MLPDLVFRLHIIPGYPILPAYLHQLLINTQKRRELQKLASGSAGSMPNISKARLSGVKVEVPPLVLQKKFAAQLETIEEVKLAQKRALSKLDSLFLSLEHLAFRGALGSGSALDTDVEFELAG
jgi:type I restriction enzyme, S subunit